MLKKSAGVVLAGAVAAAMVCASAAPFAVAQQSAVAAATPGGDATAILKAGDVGGKMPDQVFFRAQSASVQMRNAGGLKFADGMYVLAALVDTSGYSSSIQQKYQGYLIAEVPLEIEGQKLPSGEYGVGFIANNQFVVMDVGAHDLLNVKSTRDDRLKRAMPLQVTQGQEPDSYRLYFGRNYVTLKRR